tara:strand:+ start:1073 stop:1741 length:669 start_codon:yes stop_codon:yes gene_type:complete
MRYFKIYNSGSLDVIGHYPQTKYKDSYNPRLSNSHWQVPINEFPNFKPVYDLELFPESIATNFLDGCGGCHGFIVDSKLKKILEEHKLPPHKFYEINVSKNNQVLEYYWLHYIVENIWQYINYDVSKLRIQSSTNPKNYTVLPAIDEIYVKKLAKYYAFNTEFSILPEHIVLNTSNQIYDIIDLNYLNQGPLISHRLKESFTKNEISGCELKLLKELSMSTT